MKTSTPKEPQLELQQPATNITSSGERATSAMFLHSLPCCVAELQNTLQVIKIWACKNACSSVGTLHNHFRNTKCALMGLCGVEGFSSVITLPTDFCAYTRDINYTLLGYAWGWWCGEGGGGGDEALFSLVSINLHFNGMHTSLANGYDMVPALA